MKIEAGDESLASFFLSIKYKKYIKNVLTNALPGVKMRPRSGSDPENMEGKIMKKYFRGWMSLPVEKYVPACTEKAICLTVAGGYTTANDRYEWFPRSQIIIGEPNEVGNAEVLIPYWLIKQKSGHAVDFFRRLREIGAYNGEPEIVER